jgi:hypothetical protein
MRPELLLPVKREELGEEMKEPEKGPKTQDPFKSVKKVFSSEG